jgi:outer membrane protein
MNLSLKKSIVQIALILIISQSYISIAQENKFLSLQDAINLCIRNNKQLKLTLLKIENANFSVKAAINTRLPDASISGSYLLITKPHLSGPLVEKTTTPNINQAAFTIATASMPLFSGFKIKNGIESAKYLEQAVKLDIEVDKDAIIQNTIEAYSNLYKAKSNVTVIKENLKQASLRTTDFQNLESKGIVARNDLLRIQLQESNIKLALLDAESNWKLANLNMNLMLGLNENTQIEIDSNSFTLSEDNRTYEAFEEQAYTNRNDIEALQYRERSALAGIRIAKADYYPSLKLTGGYLAAYVPNFITITNAWNGGVGLSYNISSIWKTGAKINSAKIALTDIKLRESILNDQIKLEIVEAFEKYIVSKEKINVYAKALELADENNKITKNKYRNNLVTTTELLDADVQQLQAELNYTNSKADATVSYNKLKQLTGTLSTTASISK